jgi:AGCS family alanine or glycine:cation symporter
MMNEAFQLLRTIEDSVWGYLGFPIIVAFGLYLSFRSRWVQLRAFPSIVRNFVTTFSHRDTDNPTALHPIRAFFASIGGSLGIGNVVAVAAAVKIGGPGTIVWIWMTAIIGALVKYSEVYIGMSRRRTASDGTLRGGPMYFLQDAFGVKWPSTLFCLLICLYSVEIYQFGVVASATSAATGMSRWVTAGIFLAIVMLVERGGFRRIGHIASFLVPFAVVIYVFMGTYVLVVNAASLPAVLADIIHSAFSARAAEGAFVGSSLLMTMAHGVRRGCYSSDIGVGYASIIHSASSATTPAKQASLLIFEVFMDTFFVCTMSVLLVLVTGTWTEDIHDLLLVQQALGKYFPHMDLFMPFFLALLGYSVVTTYFSTGMYTMRYLWPSWGPRLYYVYAVVAFLTFAFVENCVAISVMSTVNFCLLALNVAGLWKLRNTISFDMATDRPKSKTVVERSEMSEPIVSRDRDDGLGEVLTDQSL